MCCWFYSYIVFFNKTKGGIIKKVEQIKLLKGQFEGAAKDFRGLSFYELSWNLSRSEPPLDEIDANLNQEDVIKIWQPELEESKMLDDEEDSQLLLKEFHRFYKYWLLKPNYHNWNPKAALDCFEILVRKSVPFLSILGHNSRTKKAYYETGIKVDIFDDYFWDIVNDCPGMDDRLKWLFYLQTYSPEPEYILKDFNNSAYNGIIEASAHKLSGPLFASSNFYYSHINDIFLESALLLEEIAECASNEEKDNMDVLKELSSAYKKGWQHPSGYIGSKTIVQDYKIPRPTLQGWQNQDNPKTKKDPQSQEVYYPENWFKKRLKNYSPRPRR